MLNKDVQKQIDKNGFAVITLLDPEKYLKSLKRWRSRNGYPTGFIRGCAHTGFMKTLRKDKEIRKIFQELLGSLDLVHGYDGAYYTEALDNPILPPHVDQNPDDDTICFQGALQLFGDGISVWPQPPFNAREFLKNKKHGKDAFISVPDAERYLVTLKVPAGSLIIWDSRTIHTNSSGPRACLYISFADKKNVSKDALIKLKEFKKSKECSGHDPRYPRKLH